MQSLTLIFPYYCQPKMFEFQLKHLSALSDSVKSNMELIVVDDCSPRDPLVVPSNIGIASRFFRTDVDVPWNIPFCRNLAAHHAKHDWMLFTDIDHVIPSETLEHLISGEFDTSKIYYFLRRSYTQPELPWGHHLNTIFIHHTMREQIGGDDERLAGFYAAQETDFKNRSKFSSGWYQCEEKILVVPAEVVADAGASLERKAAENYRIRQLVETMRSQIPNWKPLTMTFPWHEIISSSESKC